MSKRVFEKIKAGLDDARAFLDGTADARRYRVHTPGSKPSLDETGPGLGIKTAPPRPALDDRLSRHARRLEAARALAALLLVGDVADMRQRPSLWGRKTSRPDSTEVTARLVSFCRIVSVQVSGTTATSPHTRTSFIASA